MAPERSILLALTDAHHGFFKGAARYAREHTAGLWSRTQAIQFLPRAGFPEHSEDNQGIHDNAIRCRLADNVRGVDRLMSLRIAL